MTTHRRLYLFDIDGTLINSGGAGGRAMRAAFEALWSDKAAFNGIEFSGRTDYAILKQALISAGLFDDDFAEAVRRFKRAYFRRLRANLPASEGRVLPGVPALLQRISQDPDATVGLGTGNFRLGAGLKLGHYGLDHFFTVGGFGDSTDDRATLIAQGIRAATRKAGRHASVFVIGDTIHDITAARANGAVAVGVTTGGFDEAELSKAGADVVVETLEDAEKALSLTQ
jgi:phosphoglycolate phosphatase-like HAD superfamily hydrolase